MPNVLIVDDSATMRKIISRSIRQAGLQIDTIYEAGDGFEGLSVLCEHHKNISLILSDINMPNMDGLEFVKGIKTAGYNIPVFMITTEGGEDIIAEAVTNGALGSIKKTLHS